MSYLICDAVKGSIEGLRSAQELEELTGKEKMAQFFVEHYLGKVKEDLPKPDFDIEDIMK